jgi:hypothetical protein
MGQKILKLVMVRSRWGMNKFDALYASMQSTATVLLSQY